MKIGISALYRASGGSLTYLVQLLRAWHESGALARHRFVVYCSPQTVAALEANLPADLLSAMEIVEDAGAGRGLIPRLWAEQVVLPRRLRADAVDVLFCPANVIPYRSSAPTVVLFQNAAPFCDSVTFSKLRGDRWWFRFRLLGFFVRASAKRATKVIFISRWFRDLFVRRFGFEAGRGEVVLHAIPERPAAAAERSRLPAGVRRPFVLSVAHLNPYKNVLELVRGFVELRGRGLGEHQLVIAGQTNFPWYREQVETLIGREGAGDRVVLAGLVTPDEVNALLAACDAFVFSSTCENCPMALLEALAAGAVVACSDTGVMPEVAGEAAVYFDPWKPGSIADALERALKDEPLRNQLRARARERAAAWPDEPEIAARTLAVIESAAKAGR